ncbi:MAG: GAF domain-containing protein [Bacillota bacterium]
MLNYSQNYIKIIGAVQSKVSIGKGISRKELASLHDEILQELSMIQKPERVLRLIVRRARRLLKADASFVEIYDKASDLLSYGADSGLRSNELKRARLKLSEGGSTWWVVEERKVLLTENYFKDFSFPHTSDQLVASEGIVSGVGIPLVFEDECLGVLYVINRTETSFSPGQVELLKSFANQASITLGMAKMYEKLQKQNRQLLAINQLGTDVFGVLDLKTTISSLAEWSARLFKGSAAAVWLLEGGHLVRQGVHGTGKQGGRSRIPFAEINHLFSPDKAVQLFMLDNSVCRMFASRFKSVAVLSLTLNGIKSNYAMICIGYPHHWQIAEDDESFLLTVGKYALMAIENALSYTSVDQQLARRAGELTILHEMSRNLFTINDNIEDLFFFISTKVIQTFEVTATALAVSHDGQKKNTLWLVRKKGQDLIMKERSDLPLLSPDTDYTQEPFGVKNIKTEWAKPVASMMSEKSSNLLAIPLVLGKELLGVFIVTPQRGRQPLVPFHYNFLSQMVGLISLALKNRQLKIKARELAILGERNRIAADLHDTLIQMLFSAGLNLDRLLMDDRERGVPAEEIVRQTKNLIQKGISEVRQVIFELTGNQGVKPLAEQLENLLSQAGVEGGMTTGLQISGKTEALPLAANLFIFRLAKELVANVVKHARASELLLRLTFRSGWISLKVIDNGTGKTENIKEILNNSSFHFGLSILEEKLKRVSGKLTISNNLPQGIIAHAKIRLDAFTEGDYYGGEIK